MGSRGGQLAVLESPGNWTLVSEDTLATGRPLPGGAAILAFGGDGQSLWAIGGPPPAGGAPPASAPAGTDANAATRPATTAPATTAPATTAPAATPSTRPGAVATAPATSPATSAGAVPFAPPRSSTTIAPSPETAAATRATTAPAVDETAVERAVTQPAATRPAAAVTADVPATAAALRVGPSATTTGPSAGAAPSPSPSTAPARPLGLFVLGAGGWSRVADLPAEVPADPQAVSLSFVERAPFVAFRAGPRSVRVVRLAGTVGDSRWLPIAALEPDFDVAALKLIAGTPRPVVWVAAEQPRAALYWIEPAGPRRVDLPAAADVPGPDTAVAYAAGRVRVLSYADGKLVEQSYAPLKAEAAGAPAAVLLPPPVVLPAIARWLEPAVTIALIFTIVASIHRRREMRDVALRPDALHLAPVGRRFAAGAIDLSPLLLALGLLSLHPMFRDPAAPAESWTQSQFAILGAAAGLYLAHTVVGELVAGRSIGKVCCGLRVIGLDGERPSVAAVLIRNALRIIDVFMAFFPLLLILFSPLRQRAGDVAAGTLVVMNTKRQEQEPAGDVAAPDSPKTPD